MKLDRRVRRACALCCLTTLLLLSAPAAWGEVRLPHVFGSHMVLQRDITLRVWGWADPGEEVTVRLADHQASTQADAQGRWVVKLPPLEAGGPHTMTVEGSNKLTFEDVLVGEVWLCSGQSNMEMGINTVDNGEQEVARADYPSIRLFLLPWKTAAEPQSDIEVDWRVCNPENLGTGGWRDVGFSAVAYFFGREIHKEVGVPVGLIDSTWGGTPIEPWTPPEGFAAVPALAEIVRTIQEATPKFEREISEALTRYEQWLLEARRARDAGRPVSSPPEWPKHQLDNHTQPTGIYNAMIHPLVPFGIRGAIWYQGESNHKDGMLYFEKMKALIGGWRQVWGQGEFPFYFVQIAPFGHLYTDDQLPRLWEAQNAALSIPNTGMAVTNDISDLEDIHPRNKLDVGRRLALWALAKTYGRADTVCSGPLYKSMNVEDGRIRIIFDHVGKGLVARDGKPLDWFTVAGADHKFVAAQAEIDGDSLIVWSDEVSRPAAVRFAWSMKAEPNLMNKEGLPASAFRTDDW